MTLRVFPGILAPGLVNEDDIAYLRAKTANLPDGSHILEIGSYLGCTASVLAQSAPQSTIYCVDTWEGEPSEPKREALYLCFVMYTSQYRNIRTIKGHSRTVVNQWQQPLDLVYVDGDHSYEGAYGDLCAWWPWLKKGGWICGHDFGDSRVCKAVNDFCTQNALKFAPVPTACGMFEIQKW